MSIEKEVKDKSVIPEVFQMKMRIDTIIKNLFALPVVSLDMWKEAKEDRRKIRIGCEKFIQRQRGGTANNNGY